MSRTGFGASVLRLGQKKDPGANSGRRCCRGRTAFGGQVVCFVVPQSSCWDSSLLHGLVKRKSGGAGLEPTSLIAGAVRTTLPPSVVFHLDQPPIWQAGARTPRTVAASASSWTSRHALLRSQPVLGCLLRAKRRGVSDTPRPEESDRRELPPPAVTATHWSNQSHAITVPGSSLRESKALSWDCRKIGHECGVSQNTRVRGKPKTGGRMEKPAPGRRFCGPSWHRRPDSDTDRAPAGTVRDRSDAAGGHAEPGRCGQMFNRFASLRSGVLRQTKVQNVAIPGLLFPFESHAEGVVFPKTPRRTLMASRRVRR